LNTAFSRSINFDFIAAYPPINFTHLSWWFIRLDLGVKVFFAISGYILAVPFLKYYVLEEKRVDLKKYFIRRLTRLEPPYIITLIIFLFAHLITSSESFYALMKSFFASIFYLHGAIFNAPSKINPVAWSLEVEVQFYIIMPFFIILIASIIKKRFSILYLFILGGLLVLMKYYFMENKINGLSSSLLVFFINFFVGVLFAIFSLSSFYINVQKKAIYDFIGIASFFMMFYFYKPQKEIVNIFLFNIAIFLFFFSAFKGKLFNLFFTQKIIYVIGGMCYTIYLIHYPIFHVLTKITSKFIFFDFGYFLNFLIHAIILIPVMLAISGLFFLIFEKPFMDKDWIRKIRIKKTVQ
jgi:peptidoglycan/LPS O-acetylase OafA/YrhL